MPDDDSHTETDLASFGGGINRDPPRVQKRTRVTTRVNGERRTVGHVARTPDRDGRVFVATKDSWDHRIRKYKQDEGGVYAISTDALEDIDGHLCTRVFVHETDTNTVYEWPVAAFLKGLRVPTQYLQTATDPQRGATVDSADHAWEMTADDLYIPQGFQLDDAGWPHAGADEGTGDGR